MKLAKYLHSIGDCLQPKSNAIYISNILMHAAKSLSRHFYAQKEGGLRNGTKNAKDPKCSKSRLGTLLVGLTVFTFLHQKLQGIPPSMRSIRLGGWRHCSNGSRAEISSKKSNPGILSY
jgi:hypothetical protein